MMRAIAGIALVVLLAGCEPKSPPPAEPVKRAWQYDCELLFVVDGICIYRFYDDRTHQWVYFASRSGSVSWDTWNGRFTRHHEVETIDGSQ